MRRLYFPVNRRQKRIETITDRDKLTDLLCPYNWAILRFLLLVPSLRVSKSRLGKKLWADEDVLITLAFPSGLVFAPASNAGRRSWVKYI